MKFRESTHADNQELIEFCRGQKMEGLTQITLERSPDFFEAMEVEGLAHHVFVATKENRIIGVGTASEKRCRINGKEQWLGYLGNLRIDPKHQKGTLLPRAYNFLRKFQQEMKSKIYLTTILEENIHAKKILESGKGGLPPYKDIGKLISFVYSSNIKPFGLPSPSYTYEKATRDDLDALIRFLNTSQRQFFPQYTAEDILEEDGLLKDLSIDNFYLCKKGNEIVGCVAPWNQNRYRRWKVQAYNNWIKYTRPVINFFATMMKYPTYPPAGESLPYQILSCLHIKDDDPEILRSLLSYMWPSLERNSMIVVLIHENDPHVKVLQKPVSIKVESRLYAVYWDEEGEKIFNELGDKVPYIEGGSA